MAMSEKGVCVRILGNELQIACPKSQEAALSEAASYLEKQMRKTRNAGKAISPEKVAIVAALNITYELLNLKSTTLEQHDVFFDRVSALQAKLEHVLSTAPSLEHVDEETECEEATG